MYFNSYFVFINTGKKIVQQYLVKNLQRELDTSILVCRGLLVYLLVVVQMIMIRFIEGANLIAPHSLSIIRKWVGNGTGHFSWEGVSTWGGMHQGYILLLANCVVFLVLEDFYIFFVLEAVFVSRGKAVFYAVEATRFFWWAWLGTTLSVMVA